MYLTLVSMVTTSDSALIHCKNVLLSFANTKSKGICGVVYFFFSSENRTAAAAVVCCLVVF